MCQTTDKTTQNTCPLKTYWQEKQCWEYQCDRVSGDTSCESLWKKPCDFQIQLQNHNKQMANKKLEGSPIKSEISKKIEEIRLNIAKSIAGYKKKMILIKLKINENRNQKQSMA